MAPVTREGHLLGVECTTEQCPFDVGANFNGTLPSVIYCCDYCGCPQVNGELPVYASGFRPHYGQCDRLYCPGCNGEKARTEPVAWADVLKNHRALVDENLGGAFDCDCLQGKLL